MINNTISLGEFEFKLTSFCCPEQYDVFDADNRRVGYVRVRSGRLLCYAIDADGVRHDMILARLHDVGGFRDDAERLRWLGCCADALRAVPEWEADNRWSGDDRRFVDAPEEE